MIGNAKKRVRIKLFQNFKIYLPHYVKVVTDHSVSKYITIYST